MILVNSSHHLEKSSQWHVSGSIVGGGGDGGGGGFFWPSYLFKLGYDD